MGDFLADSWLNSNIQLDKEHVWNYIGGTKSGNDADWSNAGSNCATSILKIIRMFLTGKECETDYSNTTSNDTDDIPIELENWHHFLQDKPCQ